MTRKNDFAKEEFQYYNEKKAISKAVRKAGYPKNRKGFMEEVFEQAEEMIREREEFEKKYWAYNYAVESEWRTWPGEKQKTFDRFVKKYERTLYSFAIEGYPYVTFLSKDRNVSLNNVYDFFANYFYFAIIATFNERTKWEEQNKDPEDFWIWQIISRYIRSKFLSVGRDHEEAAEYLNNHVIRGIHDDPNKEGTFKNEIKMAIRERAATIIREFQCTELSDFMYCIPELNEDIAENICCICTSIAGMLTISMLEKVVESDKKDAPAAQNAAEQMADEEEDSSEDIINELIEANEKQLDIICKKEEEIEALKTAVEDAEKKAKKDNAEIREENVILQREYRKLKESMDRLGEKYAALREQCEQKENGTSENDPEKPTEFDAQLRYAFVCDNDEITETITKIKETFPNSRIIKGNTSLNPNFVDKVVFLTKYCDHSTYGPIKEQCKTKGISYIHIRKSNLEEIKNDIIRNASYKITE